MKLMWIAIPILSLAGIVMSIIEIGMVGDIFGLLFCWFCIFILFWWYLANIVFRPASKKERRNMAFKNVTGKRKRPPQRTSQFQNNTVLK